MSTLRISGGHVLFPDLSVARADVLVDCERGLIREVGEVSGGSQELSADGGVVMPGLVNAHTHVAMTLFRGFADDKPLRAWLEEDIWPVEAHLTGTDVRAGAELGVLEMIKSGTTGFVDMYFFEEQVARVVESAGIRAVLGHGIVSVGKNEDDAVTDVETGVSFAEEFNGAADGRIGTAVMPHSLATVGDEYLRLIASRISEGEIPVHFHANETVDHQVKPVVERTGSRPLDYADSLGLLSSESFLAHCVHLTPGEIELLRDRRAGVVHCPASNMKLASGMAPIQELLDAGVTVGIGTDGAASNNDLDMFDEIRDAAMIGKLAADDATAVSAASAVNMATAGGSEVVGWNAGRVEAGAAADLIVVDFDKPHLTPRHDVVSHLAYAVRGSDVRHSVCDGAVVMRDREVVSMDEQRVIQAAQAQSEALLDRAGVQ